MTTSTISSVLSLKRQSKTWWDKTKKSDKKITAWLQKQYIGEARAVSRLKIYLDHFNPSSKVRKVVEKIAGQEGQHADWIEDLLYTRFAVPDLRHEDRYWKHTLQDIRSFDDMCGVAWAAESMRLERIKVISGDKTAPEDIRNTFKKILKDELFHERAFRTLSSQTSKKKALVNHVKGLKSIGLSE